MSRARLTATVIDLFAGVGGLSLGAARAGFSLAAAVELDEQARDTHKKNFPNVTHLNRDVASLSGQQLLELAGVRKTELGGLIGGPPCQGFSDIGLRTAFDPRNELLVHFFRLVKETEPAFFLAENVPGVTSSRNSETLRRALELVPKSFTVLAPIVVKASEHGAPTTRTRIFFVGYDSNRIDKLSFADFVPRSKEDIRVADALDGLPAIRSNWQKEDQSWRAVGTLPPSDFAQRVMDHVPEGIGDPAALEQYLKKRLVSGFLGTAHADETIKRFRALGPGETDSVSKCRRLDRAGYCPTLRAGTGPERGSFQAVRPVHPSSPRVISPREAARLQGFPDWFQFHPTKWHSFRQIGNSVSPIAAESVLQVVARAFSKAVRRQTD